MWGESYICGPAPYLSGLFIFLILNVHQCIVKCPIRFYVSTDTSYCGGSFNIGLYF